MNKKQNKVEIENIQPNESNENLKRQKGRHYAKSNKKVNKTVVIVFCILLSLVCIASVVLLINPFKKETPIKQEVVVKEEVKQELTDEATKQKEIWKQNKNINSDYVGQLVFDSKLIEQPVVQGVDNEVYFRTNWKDMSYDEEGSIFMDYRNEPSDQNTIIYGHYVYPSYETGTLGLKEATGTRMFTPLVKLKEEKNYKDNKYLNLYYENEIARYEVAVVYHCQLDATYDYNLPVENMYYFLTNYDEEYFEKYKQTIYENAFYQTGVDLKYSDKFLTLQTCVEGRDDLLEVVVCKEISRTAY